MWAPWRRSPVLAVVLVNMKSDPTTAIRGVLWRDRGPWLVLMRAELVFGADRAPEPLVGDVWIPRENVAYLQATAPTPAPE